MWPVDVMVEIDAAFMFVRGHGQVAVLNCLFLSCSWWVLILFFVVTDEIGGCWVVRRDRRFFTKPSCEIVLREANEIREVVVFQL
jgi:hypothetical protein